MKDNDRREKGKGGIRLDPKSQKYIATYSVTVHSQRYRKSISTDTEGEAEKALALCKRMVMEDVQRGKRQKNRAKTLATITEQMMSDIKGTVDSKTYEQYEYLQSVISEGAIWERLVSDITNSDIQQFVNGINSMPERNLTAASMKKVVSFLKRIFTYAAVNKLNQYNPISDIRCIKIPKSAKTAKAKPRAITTYECAAILAVVEQSDTYKPFVYTLLYTGLRIGELLALSWNEVDLDAGMLSVRYAVKQRVQDKPNAPKRFYERSPEPKTSASVRDIPISQNLVEILREWKAAQKNGKGANGFTLRPDTSGFNLVFPNQYGKLRSYDGTARRFRFFLKEQGLDPKVYHFHAFRHTFASYLAKQKVAPQTMRALLGHTDIKTTLNYYVDSDMDSQVAAIEELDAVIGGLATGKTGFVFDVAI